MLLPLSRLPQLVQQLTRHANLPKGAVLEILFSVESQSLIILLQSTLAVGLALLLDKLQMLSLVAGQLQLAQQR
jgi:hypothetical protein